MTATDQAVEFIDRKEAAKMIGFSEKTFRSLLEKIKFDSGFTKRIRLADLPEISAKIAKAKNEEEEIIKGRSGRGSSFTEKLQNGKIPLQQKKRS